MRINRLIKKAANTCGLEISHRGEGRCSDTMGDVLARVKGLGLVPQTVFDAGAAQGTNEVYEAFPDAFHVLIEPLTEFEPFLLSLLNTYKGAYVAAAAGSQPGRTRLNVHPDHLDGSSMFKERMGREADGVERDVPVVTIDDLAREKGLEPPYVIKVDVQGSELDVLEGSRTVLEDTALVLMEVSMFEFMRGAPQFFDVVLYMKEHGFVAYDLFGLTPRPLDGALGQLDMAFVKEKGFLRKDHAYATIEQWRKRT